MDMETRKIEDKAAVVCFALSLGGMLGTLYAYSLGKQAGKLTLSTSEDSAHLPVDDSGDADSDPDPAGDE